MSYIGNEPTSVAFLTDTFSGNGSTTAFTMSAAPATTTSILVAVTGVLQDPSTYSVVGTTLTFSAAPPSGTGNISVRYLGIPASGVTTTAYRTITEFTATAGQTTFTPPSYTPGFINVYRNGALLSTTDYTATNGTTVVLGSAASASDLVTIESFYVSSVLNALPNTGGTLSGNLNVIGDEYVSGNVGIGTSSPVQRLTVESTSNVRATIRNSTENTSYSSSLDFATGSGSLSSSNVVGRVVGVITQADPSTLQSALAFHTNSGDSVSEKMRIDASGNVGIGGTGSGQRLFVDSGAYLWTTRFTSSNGVATALEVSNSTTRTWEFAVGGNTPAGTLPAGGMYFYDQSAGAARLTIDTSGRVSMPAQVGFKVGRTSPAQTVANGGACIFNTTATSGGFNTGSAYNTSTGNFTAPISGRYIFNATVIFESVANGTNFADIILTVNGGAAAYGLRQTYVTNTTGSGGFFVDKISVILNLVVGDVVAVINNTGTSKTLHANPGFAIFDGYLLG